MPLLDPVFGLKLVFVLGIINLVGFFLVLFSCRCLLGKLINPKNSLHALFYKYHCYYWWLFLSSVFLHTILAFDLFGSPF